MGKILVIKGADFSAVAVGKVEPVSGVKITVTGSPVGWGTTTGSGTYNEGESIQITAVPSSGYKFSQWNDGNTQATRTVVVGSSAKTYTATFVVKGEEPANIVNITSTVGTALVSNDASKYGPEGTLFKYNSFGVNAVNVSAGDTIKITGASGDITSYRWGLFDIPMESLVAGDATTLASASVAYQNGYIQIAKDGHLNVTAERDGCLVLTPSGVAVTFTGTIK